MNKKEILSNLMQSFEDDKAKGNPSNPVLIARAKELLADKSILAGVSKREKDYMERLRREFGVQALYFWVGDGVKAKKTLYVSENGSFHPLATDVSPKREQAFGIQICK